MSSSEFGSYTLLLVILLAVAHLLGYVFTRLRLPRVIGEILAGVLLGPTLLGRFAPNFSTAAFGTSSTGVNKNEIVLSFLAHLGMLLLMFASGAETKGP